MSKLVIANQIITFNNGTIKNDSNKCAPLAISQGAATDCEFIIDFLGLSTHEETDFDTLQPKFQELADMLGINIYVHGGKHLSNGFTRIWTNTLKEIITDNDYSNYHIHLIWYGHHFEYVDWNQIDKFPDFDKNVFDAVVTLSDNPQEILFMYNYNVSI